MIVKLLIKKPENMNSKNFKYSILKKILFSKGKIKKEINNKNNTVWIVDLNPRQYNNLIKNVSIFQVMTKQVFNNKAAKKAIRKMSDSEEVYNKTKELLLNGTEISLIKQSDPDYNLYS